MVIVQLDSTKSPEERRPSPVVVEEGAGKVDVTVRSPISPQRLYIAEDEAYSSPQNSQATTDVSPVGSTQSRGSAVKCDPVDGAVNFRTEAGSPSSCSAKSSTSKSPQFPSSSATSCRSVSSSTSFLTATSTTNTSTSPSLSASSTASTGSTVGGNPTVVQTLPRKHSAPPFPGAISAGASLAMCSAAASPSALSDSIQLAIVKQQSTVAEHKNSTQVEKRHKCPVCDKAFPYLSILESHKRCHTGEKPFCCHFCDKAFAQKATLQVHERTHTGERPYQCRYCPKTFAQYGTKTVHEKSAHLGIRNYKCPKCSKCLSSPSALYTHKKTHGEKTYQCQFCPKQFTLKNYLKLHVKQVHEQNERKHQCRYCQKTFAYAGSLQVHVRTHTGERPYMCRYCPKAFASQGNLQSHERTHTGERPFACQLCGRAFIQKSQLSAHEATHAHKNHQHAAHSATAAHCGESAIATLASAAASVASCEQRQQKREQGSEESSTSDLIDIEGDYPIDEHHDSTIHNKFEAALNGHCSTTNAATSAEPTTAAGAKPPSSSNEFVCKYCGKRYAYASSLYVHTRLHTGERPFRCGYCSKEFTNQGNMQVHQRVHTGERPYKCESCGKCYAQKVGLKIHQEQCQPYLSRRGSVATNASSTNDSEMSAASGGEDPTAMVGVILGGGGGGEGEQHTTQQQHHPMRLVNGLSLGVLDSHLINVARAPQLPPLQSQPTCANTLGAVYSQARVLASTPQSSSSQPSSVFTSPMHSHRPSVTGLFPAMSSPAHSANTNSIINHGELEAHLLRLMSQQQQQIRDEPTCSVITPKQSTAFQNGRVNASSLMPLAGLLSSPPPDVHHTSIQPIGIPGFMNTPSSGDATLVTVSSSGCVSGGSCVAPAPTVLSPLVILQQHQQQQALLTLLEQAHLQQQQQQQQANQLRQLLLLKSILELENQTAAAVPPTAPPPPPPQPLLNQQPSREQVLPLSSPGNGSMPNSMIPLPQPQPIYPASSSSASSSSATVGMNAANAQFHQQLLQLLQTGGQDLIEALQQQQAPSSSSQ